MKTFGIVRRIVKEILGDKRTIALILIGPLFLFTLLFLLLGDSDFKPNIGVNGMPKRLVEAIETQGATVTPVEISEGKVLLQQGTIDAFLYKQDKTTMLAFDMNDTIKTSLISKDIQNGLKQVLPFGSIDIEFLHGNKDANLFDNLAYIMLGIVSFFLIFILAGISFVRENTGQTMERLLMSPIKRWQVILGYTLGFGVFAILQSIVLLAYCIIVLHMGIAGSALSVGFIMVLLALSAVCIGAFFSIFSNNEFQMMQFIPIIVIPQIFFSGIIPLDTIPLHLGLLSKIMPVYYACDALKALMLQGASLQSVIGDIGALLVCIGLFFFLNIIALKKYRTL
ncbi:ABC transporter permease [uncultured Sphaerochaeta sp.]|uniref:ABC transporter permease n=1 Tax=uncultured Sphaerochaeta sp. TaxID=886478 RepID=UPI002A0A2A87|nr:ABC transporter permease [uncultured Sphaerochaeta sp.]